MWETQGSASTEPVIFCCGKTVAAAILRLSRLFMCSVHTANPTEYYFMMWQGDPVKFRNNRPLLC